MEPARTIIKALGGPVALSRKLGMNRVSVQKWMRPKEKGGTGGLIPIWHVQKLIDLGREEGVALTAQDFIKKVPEAAE